MKTRNIFAQIQRDLTGLRYIQPDLEMCLQICTMNFFLLKNLFHVSILQPFVKLQTQTGISVFHCFVSLLFALQLFVIIHASV